MSSRKVAVKQRKDQGWAFLDATLKIKHLEIVLIYIISKKATYSEIFNPPHHFKKCCWRTSRQTSGSKTPSVWAELGMLLSIQQVKSIPTL